MELDELKSIWKEDDKKFGNRIELNEKLVQKMNMNTTVLEFDKLISKSILGRNMALVYCGSTLILASFIIEQFEYSLPAIIGSLAMLWSFIDHLSISKPDYSRISVVELQKSICNFRIHTSKTAKYDIAIVLLWQITSTPLFLKVLLKISIYSNLKYFVIFCLFTLVISIIMGATSRKIYEEYDQKLKEAETDLEKILDFEKG